MFLSLAWFRYFLFLCLFLKQGMDPEGKSIFFHSLDPLLVLPEIHDLKLLCVNKGYYYQDSWHSDH